MHSANSLVELADYHLYKHQLDYVNLIHEDAVPPLTTQSLAKQPDYLNPDLAPEH